MRHSEIVKDAEVKAMNKLREISEADRWLIDGDCRKCRRAKYCSKRCRLNFKRIEEFKKEVLGNKENDIENGRMD